LNEKDKRNNRGQGSHRPRSSAKKKQRREEKRRRGQKVEHAHWELFVKMGGG